jgi:anaerobic ribonucleoside-triphosphate reductase
MKITTRGNLILNEAEIELVESVAREEQAKREEKAGTEIAYVEVWPDEKDPLELCVEVKFKSPITRLARITGYLSSINRWNDGKKAELADRVSHDIDF